MCWSLWTLGLALLCAVVFAGQGGALKALLELPLWSPLARLTFSTYLVHPMVIMVGIAARGGMPAHFSLVHLFFLFIGYSALSGLSAFLFYFWVEGPFGELERLLFHRQAPSKAAAHKAKTVDGAEDEADSLSKDRQQQEQQQNPGTVVIVPLQEESGMAVAQ